HVFADGPHSEEPGGDWRRGDWLRVCVDIYGAGRGRDAGGRQRQAVAVSGCGNFGTLARPVCFAGNASVVQRTAGESGKYSVGLPANYEEWKGAGDGRGAVCGGAPRGGGRTGA